jgi:hypothetical protein
VLTVIATLMLLPALRRMPEPVAAGPLRARPVDTGRARPEPRRDGPRRPALKLRRPRLPRRARRSHERL